MDYEEKIEAIIRWFNESGDPCFRIETIKKIKSKCQKKITSRERRLKRAKEREKAGLPRDNILIFEPRKERFIDCLTHEEADFIERVLRVKKIRVRA